MFCLKLLAGTEIFYGLYQWIEGVFSIFIPSYITGMHFYFCCQRHLLQSIHRLYFVLLLIKVQKCACNQFEYIIIRIIIVYLLRPFLGHCQRATK